MHSISLLLLSFVLVVATTAVNAESTEETSQGLRGRGGDKQRDLTWWWRRCPVLRCANPCPPDTCASNEECVTKRTRLSWRCEGCPAFDKCVPQEPTEDICLPLPCANPCGQCQDGETCKTSPSFYEGPNGQQCPGCPIFEGCEPPLIEVEICPMLACANPCGECQLGETCKTKPSFIEGPNGQQCPGCPAFDGCEPELIPVDICPIPACAPFECPCGEGETCKTRTSFFEHNGKQCPGCPMFDRCEPPVEVVDICPIPACAPLECPCGEGETCKTRTGFFEFNGKQCPGCPVFDRCESSTQQPCGRNTCGEGLVCCNASCGICTRPDMFCTQQACEPVDVMNGGY